MQLDKPQRPIGTQTKLRTYVVVCALLAIAVVAIYANVAHFGINDFDDVIYIYDNPHVRTGLTLDNVAWSLTAAHAANWHPLTWISHMVDVELFGLDPGGHHITNILIHIFNSWLVFLILASATGSVWRSAFVAAIFAVHPLNVGSVAWIAERKNVLSTTFWLLTVGAYFSYARHGGTWRYLAVIVLFALGLASKPMLVTLPFILIFLDIWPLGRANLRDIRSYINKLPLIALSALTCWITMIVQSDGGMTRSLQQFPVGQRLANAVVSYMTYIGKMIWPSKLCLMYPHPKDTLPVWVTITCAVALAVITILAIVCRRKRPYVIAGWFWYLITLVPVIGLVQVGTQGTADRYAYVPLIGLFMLIAWLVPDLSQRFHSRWLAVPALVILVALGVRAYVQAQYWRDTETLYHQALKVTDNDAAVFYWKAGALSDSGENERALEVLQDAMKFSKEPEVVHNFMGMVLTRAGKPQEAVEHYRKAIAIKPDFAVAHNNLGTALARMHKLDEAESHLRKAIELEPRYTEPRHSLGVILYWQGRRGEAIRQWKRALEINPRLPDTRRRLQEAESERR